MIKFHLDGTAPPYEPRNVFVFGSNKEGRHGLGAAHFALIHFDAVEGESYGHHGRSFAIPTKHTPKLSMTPTEVQPGVDGFLKYARRHQDLRFFVTRIGCGYAGMRDEQIAPMFRGATENCSFANEWRVYLL